MSETRYALTWSIGGRRRGVFCPAGGMTHDEAEMAKERLYERARANGVKPVRDPGPDQDRSIGATVVPYVFDVDNDPIEGLS